MSNSLTEVQLIRFLYLSLGWVTIYSTLYSLSTLTTGTVGGMLNMVSVLTTLVLISISVTGNESDPNFFYPRMNGPKYVP